MTGRRASATSFFAASSFAASPFAAASSGSLPYHRCYRVAGAPRAMNHNRARMHFAASPQAERRSTVSRCLDMSVFLFIGGVTAVAGGSLAALYCLIGSAPRDSEKESKHHPVKKPLMSQWR